ncbi:MAG: hypothetical protein GYA21_00335 [Myxococcales bacterium]|nr:hypothetical protein [Myxococcales bacterium]
MKRILWTLVLAGLGVVGCTGKITTSDAGDDASSADGADSGPIADGDGAPADGRGDAGLDAGDPGAPDGGDRSADAGDGSDAGGDDGPQDTLSARHPNDVGMGDDPAVVWFEDFEEGSLAAIAGRYDQVRDNGRFTLTSDTPSGAGFALAMRAGEGQEAVDLYKMLPSGEEWYVRWYAKYQRDITWHHSGMWFGGYNPPSRWPSPGAGTRPRGDDRFSISVEPVFGSPALRFDFYNYWMTMHSWMANPVDDGTAYYGNALVHRNDFTVDEEHWVCLEVHVRLNTDLGSGQGAILEVWKNDVLVQRFDDTGPLGYWIRDKFCTAAADGAECTDYPAPFDQVLDLQFRSTADLALNAFWPQNYITEGPAGTLTFDQMVVATRRVGCMHR